VLFAANLFWVVAYDTEYAMVDRDDDLRIGLRSSAILFGRADVAAVAGCYAAHLLLLAAIGTVMRFSWRSTPAGRRRRRSPPITSC